MTDSPGAPDDDFDDQTELVAHAPWVNRNPAAPARGSAASAPAQTPPAAAPLPALPDLPEGGEWDEEEATAVVSSTDIGGFFGERFRVDARLGIGAMGRVLTAVDMKTGTLVALKVLHKDRQKDAAVVERFQREAAVLREMRHPAIVQLVAFDRAKDGSWWLAMEHLVGKTLKDRIAQGGPFAPRDVWPVLASVCDGVAFAHEKGILHRDLKPENILLLEAGRPPCKILDFGLSRYTAKPDRITATGTVLGTPRYMAPEMLAENANIDERADVFALGAIAFEMLTGRSIYPAEDFGQLFGCILEGRTLSLRSVRPDAPPELDRVLADAVARDQAQRVRSVDELANRLARALGVSPDRSVFLPAAGPVARAPARAARPQDTIREMPETPLAPVQQAPVVAARLVPPPAGFVAPAAPPPPAAAMPVAPVGALPRPRLSAPTPLPTPPSAPLPHPAPGGFAAPPPAAPPTAPGGFAAPPLAAAPTPMAAPGNPGFVTPAPVAPVMTPAPAFGMPPNATPGEGLARPSYVGTPRPASFTRPEKAIPLPIAPSPAPRRRWLWVGLFLAAALVTMLGAGALAYVARAYLFH